MAVFRLFDCDDEKEGYMYNEEYVRARDKILYSNRFRFDYCEGNYYDDIGNKEAYLNYGLPKNASGEEVLDAICANLNIPTYQDFKEDLYFFIKGGEIIDSRKKIKEVFNGNDDFKSIISQLHTKNGCFKDEVFNLFSELVEERNYYVLFTFPGDECESLSITEINYLASKNPEYKKPLEIYESYLDMIEKEDLQEVKDLIMSLAQDEE